MSDNQKTRLTGYAHTHGAKPSEDDGEGWLAYIPREALERAVQRTPEVPVTLDFGGRPIGTAKLTVDDVGLRCEFDLDIGFAYQTLEEQCVEKAKLRSVEDLRIAELAFTRTPLRPTTQQLPCTGCTTICPSCEVRDLARQPR